ncbi:MAG: TIGR03000 domain-containing protein [Gemmataceae bacterium]|nr:TIGR03000 domain-containing protein [Gemmataceae bacterium]
MYTRWLAYWLLAVGMLLTAGGIQLRTMAQDIKSPSNTQESKKEQTKDNTPRQEPRKVKSKLLVKVPDEDAELRIEGQLTKPTGLERRFVTPELDEGRPYIYEFKVTWRPNNYTELTRTKVISFKGGEDLVVDLTRPDPNNPDKAKVRWVPTPDDIVEEMVKLAGVKKGDIVYEPGPGDGRVLIACVKSGADKAVGIELDPKKAEEARANAKKAGVADKVEIRVGDALQVTDYGNATVIMLYMGDEFNNLLRPLFEKQLKPGTRIVSHRFTMGDWKPDKTITVQGRDGDEYVLHLWIVKKPEDKEAKGSKEDKEAKGSKEGKDPKTRPKQSNSP